MCEILCKFMMVPLVKQVSTFWLVSTCATRMVWYAFYTSFISLLSRLLAIYNKLPHLFGFLEEINLNAIAACAMMEIPSVAVCTQIQQIIIFFFFFEVHSKFWIVQYLRTCAFMNYNSMI